MINAGGCVEDGMKKFQNKKPKNINCLLNL